MKITFLTMAIQHHPYHQSDGQQKFGTHFNGSSNSLNYIEVLATIDINQVISKTLSKALERDDGNQWADIVQNEENSLIKNNTWSLTKLFLGRHAIDCNWVFCIKHKANSQVDKYKAYLVAKGYSQVSNIDYTETFSL
jgi:hypothetical protein